MEAKQFWRQIPSKLTSHSSSSSSSSSIYQALIRAGPNLKQLHQVHARSIVCGSHHSLSFITKLLTLACAAGSILYTRKLFLSIPNPDSFLFSSLIKSSAKFHFPLHAIFFYRCMFVSSVLPSSHAFTAVVKACGEIQELGTGRAVHCHVLVCGFVLDLYVQAAMISFYAKCGELGVARMVFDKMPERTVVAWNSMISAYEQNGLAEDAVSLFCRMRDSGVEFDSATFVGVLSACSQLGDFSLGCWVHEYANSNAFKIDVVLGTALINMYARCGHVNEARKVFDQMRVKNVVAWTAIISAYGTHGYGEEAVTLFHLMKSQGPRPNNITFVVVLSACAHSGLVEEARQVFDEMSRYNIVPGMEHHVCMVDMLGRAGLLSEAFQYIKQMKTSKPAPAVWTAMLGACKMHKNYKIGLEVAELLLSSEPDNPGHYVLLSNIYAMAGQMDKVEAIRNIMIRKGLKKQVGYSTIEIDQKTYLFSMGDESHAETVSIYNYLNELIERCKDLGYIPVSESVMHEVEEEERDYALMHHSEKLAIAFGLLKTSNGTAIRIVKNLRMCEDCHLAIKFISVSSCREIIVRDKLRFHHFKNGSCSCGDYW